MKKKKELNSKMRHIINVLHKKGGAMSAHEISQETGISYTTVQKYLKVLLEKEVIVEDAKTKNSKNYKKKND